MLYVLIIVLMMLSYTFDVKLRVICFVSCVLVLFHIADNGIDSLALANEQEISQFFTLALVLTGVVSVKISKFLILLSVFLLLRRMLFTMLQGFLLTNQCHERRASYKSKSQKLLKQLKARAAQATYVKAKTARGLLLDLLKLEVNDLLAYGDAREVRQMATYFSAYIKVYLDKPAYITNKDAACEKQLCSRLDRLTHFLQHHLDKYYPQEQSTTFGTNKHPS